MQLTSHGATANRGVNPYRRGLVLRWRAGHFDTKPNSASNARIISVPTADRLAVDCGGGRGFRCVVHVLSTRSAVCKYKGKRDCHDGGDTSHRVGSLHVYLVVQSTNCSNDHRPVSIPAAIAGVIRSVLSVRAKLQWAKCSEPLFWGAARPVRISPKGKEVASAERTRGKIVVGWAGYGRRWMRCGRLLLRRGAGDNDDEFRRMA